MVDGSAAITLSVGNGEKTLFWVAPTSGGSRPKHWGALVGTEVAEPLRSVVGGALARALKSPLYALLPFVNRSLATLSFGDTVVDTFLAGRLAPGHTRWFAWVLSEVFQGAAHRFSLHFDGPQGRLSFVVTSPGVTLGEAEALVHAPHYRLWLTADPRPVEARAVVSEQVERFLGFLLARAVHPDLVLVGDVAPRVHDGVQPDTVGADPYGAGAPVSTSRWGNPGQWHQFFSDFEVARAGLCGLTFTEPMAFITHGEPECQRVEPPVRPRPHVFARLPFAHRWVVPEPGSREFVSVIGEREVVFGATPMLERVMAAAQEHPQSRFVMLNNTCLPKMVGDDVTSVAPRSEPGMGKPVVVMNTDLDSPEATYHDLVRQLALVGEVAPSEQAKGVALLGFPPGRGRDELTALCEALGLPVAGCLGPELSVLRAETFRRAALHVIWPAPPWPSLREELFGHLPVPMLVPRAPLGMEGSRTWFAAVAEALRGDQGDLAGPWQEHVGPLSERFDSLRAKVRGAGVGFVVDAKELDRLVEPTRSYGVSLLPLIAECGFVVHVLMRLASGGDSGEQRASARLRLEEALGPGAEMHIHPFEQREELEDLLSGDAFSMVYSELSCDDRLARHGLLGFGLDSWELGPEGAVRSLERMLRLSRWPFFARYGRFGRHGSQWEVHEHKAR